MTTLLKPPFPLNGLLFKYGPAFNVGTQAGPWGIWQWDDWGQGAAPATGYFVAAIINPPGSPPGSSYTIFDTAALNGGAMIQAALKAFNVAGPVDANKTLEIDYNGLSAADVAACVAASFGGRTDALVMAPAGLPYGFTAIEAVSRITWKHYTITDLETDSPDEIVMGYCWMRNEYFVSQWQDPTTGLFHLMVNCRAYYRQAMDAPGKTALVTDVLSGPSINTNIQSFVDGQWVGAQNPTGAAAENLDLISGTGQGYFGYGPIMASVPLVVA